MTPQLELFRGWASKLDRLGIRGKETARKLFEAIVARESRGRLDGARTWSRIRWAAELGVDRLAAVRLVDVGIARWDGDTFVWVDFDSRSEDRKRAFADLQRTRARARWDDRMPDRMPDRVVAVNSAKSLRVVDAAAYAAAHARKRSPFEDRSAPSDSEIPDTPSKTAPSGVPSVSRRVAAASAGRVAAPLELRRREVGLAPDAPPSRLAARAGRKQRDVRPFAAGQGLEARGGPDFKLWYDRYRASTGQPAKRSAAEAEWNALAMSAAEARWCMRHTQEVLADWRRRKKQPANALAFMAYVWGPTLRLARAKQRPRLDVPTSTGDNMPELLERIRGRA